MFTASGRLPYLFGVVIELEHLSVIKNTFYHNSHHAIENAIIT